MGICPFALDLGQDLISDSTHKPLIRMALVGGMQTAVGIRDVITCQ